MMFEMLNSYRYFNEWSPWAKRDPKASSPFLVPNPVLAPDELGR